MTILEELEEQVGSALVPLRDKLDVLMRQQDPDVLRLMEQLTQAYDVIAVLRDMELRAQRDALLFQAVPEGGSVVDALWESAAHMFPRALAVARKAKGLCSVRYVHGEKGKPLPYPLKQEA
jgi:hypothetical protein